MQILVMQELEDNSVLKFSYNILKYKFLIVSYILVHILRYILGVLNFSIPNGALWI